MTVETEIFRKIGKRLLEEMPSIFKELGGKGFLRIGASGDKTYPIDQKAEEIILEELEKFYRDGGRFTVISEEYGVKDFGDREKKILIDPVDGSNNARRGVPFYSTSMALVKGDSLRDTKASYVINLVNGDEFWAMEGEGAFMAGERIKASNDPDIGLILYEATSPSRDLIKIIPLLKKAKRLRCLGSTALDFSYLAKGSCSLLLIPFPSRSFDYAAGWLILKEAGGITTDFFGNDISETPVGIERTVSIVGSANHDVHQKALEIIRREIVGEGHLAHRHTR